MKKITRRSYNPQATVLAVHPVLQRIYTARGIVNASEIAHGLDQLQPYHSLLGIYEAARYLSAALTAQRKILIIGDFDADGATATVIAMRALRAFGAQQVTYLVPNRFEYGYGLTPAIVAVAARWEPDVIITVDNGISSIAGVNAAKELGIDVIITDHHLAAATLPAAIAIVNPNQPDDPFPSKALAGVGVIYYVMLALRAQLQQADWFKNQGIVQPNMADLLDLVALGTVADVVPLDKNNRILVSQGLQRIRAGKCCAGIRALLQVAKRTQSTVTASDLAFSVGPRLNAAGRLDDMSLGIECLLAESLPQALEHAQQLHELNIERRSIEGEMQTQALEILKNLHWEQRGLPLGLCLYDPSWHQGVIGIVAGRIKDKLHRPVIAFADASDGEYLKGSARSVIGINVRDSLDAIAKKHPTLLEKFGGHAMAAGLSLDKAQLPQFKQAFEQQIASEWSDAQCVAEIVTDGPLSVAELTLELAQLLRGGGPWGQHFPEPLFDNQFVILQQRVVGGKHLKLSLTLENSPVIIDAIAFNIDERQWPNYRCHKLYAVYRLDINEYQGHTSLQLLIEHLEAN